MDQHHRKEKQEEDQSQDGVQFDSFDGRKDLPDHVGLLFRGNGSDAGFGDVGTQPLNISDEGNDFFVGGGVNAGSFEVISNHLCLFHEVVIGPGVISGRVWDAECLHDPDFFRGSADVEVVDEQPLE